MRSGKYRRARTRLHSLLRAKLQSDAEARDGGKQTPEHLRKVFARDADDMLDEFEALAERHGSWRAIWQSFAGSWLYTASLGLIALALYCSRLDFRELVTTRLSAPVPPAQKALSAP